jgi:ABC-2 type transport system permease protein
MTTLIRTEWLKMRKYNAFWWIMGILILSYPGIIYMFYFGYQENVNNPADYSQYLKLGIGNPFTFPEVWHTVAYCSSLFVFIPSVVGIMLICNEYTYRTHRQNIIDGWSRSQFVTSKLIDVFLITVIVTILYTIIALVVGFAAHDRLIRDTWSMSYYIGLFALQTFAQLSIAFLLGFLIKKAFLALGAFLFLFFVLDNILWAISEYYKSDIGHYLPLEISDRIIIRPAFTQIQDIPRYNKMIAEIPQFVILTVIVTALIWLLCYRVNNRRDLK